MTARVLFYVQHLLGIGHLMRASRIARALVDAGLDVHVVLGGAAVEGIPWAGARLHQLPAIKAGPAGYADLVDAAGRPVDDALRERRRRQLLAELEAIRPDIVLIEAFPFGRRALRFELLPLVEAAAAQAPPALVVSSIRDILHENRKARLNDETVDLLRRHFDLVLVHGDPGLIPIEASFPRADAIADLVRYTGLVAAGPASAQAEDTGDVIVSAGGGAVGEALLRAAVAARPLTRHADARWTIVTGPNLPEPVRRDLEREAGAGVAIRRFVADLPAALAAARVSVSQCGYNTAADVLAAGCRAVFVPIAYQGETEQVRRARLLEARNLAVVVEEPELTPARLAAAIDAADAMPPPDKAAVPDLGGAARSAGILIAHLARASRRDRRVV